MPAPDYQASVAGAQTGQLTLVTIACMLLLTRTSTELHSSYVAIAEPVST